MINEEKTKRDMSIFYKWAIPTVLYSGNLGEIKQNEIN